MSFTVQYMEHLLPGQQSEVLVVLMQAYDLVLGLHQFQYRNPDIDWQRNRLLSPQIPGGVEVLAVDRVDHQECPANIPGSMAKEEEACSEEGRSIPDTQILAATAVDNLLASEKVVGTFFLRVGDCTGLLRATFEGISEDEWDWPEVLDVRAGGSGGSCSRSTSTWEYWMTANGTLRHKGSSGRWALGLPWANSFKYGLLDIPPYCFLYIYIMNGELTFSDEASKTTKKVPTDNREHILAIYRDFVKVFSKGNAQPLPLHWSTDHAIDMEPSYILPYVRIHNLSEFKLRMLNAFIEGSLANKFFRQSSLPVAAQFLFAKKSNRGLRLGINYRVLNMAMVKNLYPLLLISEMLDCMRKARIFTKLDLRSVYDFIQIKEDDKYKMAFWTCYGQFEYRVMPFGLTNAPATFESYIDDCLWPFIDDFTIGYQDDILIHLRNEEENKEYVYQVLLWLKEFGLYCKAGKCQFWVSEVSFPAYVVTPDGVGMDSDWISTIEDWPTPKSDREVQVLLRFIWKYTKVSLPLMELLKKLDTSQGKKLEGSAKWE